VEKEARKKLAAALAPLKAGKTIDGKPLKIGLIAAEAHAGGRAYAGRIAVAEAMAAQRLQNRRFKG